MCFRCSAPTPSGSGSPPKRQPSARDPRLREWDFARTSSAAAPTTPSTRSTGASNSRSSPAHDARLRALPQQAFEALLANAVERLEIVDLGQRLRRPVIARETTRRQDHLVLARVFQRHEFEHFGVVASGFEQQGAKAVGHHLGFLAEMDAVTEQGAEG